MQEYFVVGSPIHVVGLRGYGSGGVSAVVQVTSFFWSPKVELLRHFPKGPIALYQTLNQASVVAKNAAHFENGSIYMPPVFRVAIDDFTPLEFDTEQLEVPEKRSNNFFIHSPATSIESAKSHTDVLKVLSGWVLYPDSNFGSAALKEISLINPKCRVFHQPKNIKPCHSAESTKSLAL